MNTVSESTPEHMQEESPNQAESLLAIKELFSNGHIDFTQMSQPEFEEFIKQNLDSISAKLSTYVKDPLFFIDECKRNPGVVAYAITRTPLAFDGDPENEHLYPSNYFANLAEAICGDLKINMEEGKAWHTPQNREKVMWNGWQSNPNTPYFSTYFCDIDENSDASDEVTRRLEVERGQSGNSVLRVEDFE